MTNKHTPNNFFDDKDWKDCRFRLSKEDRKKLRQICKTHGLLGLGKTEIMRNVIELALSNNGIGKIEEREELPYEARFDCNKFCRKSRTCNFNGKFELGEIIANRCYVSKYPYQWKTPDGRLVRVCKFMVFPNDNPNDPKNPYPKCIAKQKDVPIQLPRDRIMRNPQICWTCYMRRKKVRETAREKELMKRNVRGFSAYPKVNYGNSEGLPPWYSE